MSNIYYIYAYVRSNGTPYYIGKGKDKRAWEKHKIAKPKDKTRIVIMESGLTEIGALALERRYIRWYGRKDIGTGILRNMTDGGEGSSGYIAWHRGKRLSPEHRRNIGISNIGKHSKLKGNIHTEESKKKISAANKGRTPWIKGKKHSEEAKRKSSEASKAYWNNQRLMKKCTPP